MTLNDHPDIRALFASFEMERVEIQYTVGGAEYIAQRGELIIYSGIARAIPWGYFDHVQARSKT